MVQNEFKFIAKNKIILISLIAIMIIPFLYSIFFLKSVWDPYGSTGNLPVAVVNNDVPTTYEGQKLNAGKDLVKELKKNDQIGWRFVSAKKAKQGLKDKEYYTVITLPKNFSANAATVLDKHPKKMQINYKTNDSLNFIAEVISEAGAKQVNAELRETVTKSYAKVMFKQVKTAGKGFTTAAKGAKKLTDGSITLADGLNTYTAGVDKVNDGVMTMKTSVVPLSDGVKKLADGSKALDTGLQTLNGKTGTLASGASQLNSGASQLNTGLQTLNSKTGALSTGVTQLNSGASQLNGGLNKLTANSDALNDGVDTLDGGVSQLLAGSSQLTAGLVAASNGIDKKLPQKEEITKLVGGLGSIDSGIQQMDQELNHSSMPDIDAAGITSGLMNIKNNSKNTGNLLQSTGASLGNINTKLFDQTNTNSAAVNLGKTKAELEQISSLVQSSGATDAEKAKIMALVGSAGASTQAVGTQLTSAGSDAANIKTNLGLIGADTASNGESLKTISSQMQTIQALIPKLTSLKAGVAALASDDPENGGHTALVQAQGAITQLVSGLETVNAGLKQTGSTPNTMGAIQASSTINAGLKQVQVGLKGTTGKLGLVPGLLTYTNGVASAQAGSTQLAAGTTQLNGQVPALTGGIGQLASGSSQLAAGTAQLNSQVPQLTSGVSQLATGSTTLNGGLVQLNGKIPTLTSGVDQLADGTSQLAANSTKLNSGATQLKNGNKTLTTGLNTGANKVNSIKLTNSTADMFAAPSDLKHSNYSYVPNYGHALAPYVLSLALFVGAIVFNFAYPIRKISMEGQSATAWFLSKIAVGAIVAIGMGLIEPALMMVAGLNVDHPAQLFLISVTFALTSMAIIMFLSMAFDNPGRFLAMVLLMLQLGGSGGTFPMEITNHFYNVIHPFLPMSYSILGFRQAITSGLGNGQIVQTFFVLLLFIAIALVLLWISMTHLQKIGQAGISQLDDNQKLQDVEK
ncbi:YhgE/Pip family protein [Latilactobacillus fuchuensis]